MNLWAYNISWILEVIGSNYINSLSPFMGLTMQAYENSKMVEVLNTETLFYYC